MTIYDLFDLVQQTTLYGSIVGILLLLIKALPGKKLPPKWQYLLWMILLLKLLAPFGPESVLSIFNLAKPQVSVTETGEVTAELMLPHTSYSLPQSDFAGNTDEALFFPFTRLIPYIWFAGFSAMMGWLLVTTLLLSVRLRRHSIVPCPHIAALFEKCRAKVHTKRNIELMTQNYIKSPSLFGFIRPKILLPDDMAHLTDKQIEYILLHELSHYKRMDSLINYFLLVLQAIHWFNPIIWYCFRKMRQDMELATDEKTMCYMGSGEYKEYGLALISALERFAGEPRSPRLLGVANDSKNIKKRIKMIASYQKPKVFAQITAVAATVLVSAICLTNAPIFYAVPEAGEAIPATTPTEDFSVATRDIVTANENVTLKEAEPQLSAKPESVPPQPSEQPPASPNASPSPTPKHLSEAQGVSSSAPSQKVRPVQKDSQNVSGGSERLLPGTNLEYMRAYLQREGKTEENGAKISLKNSYSHIKQSGSLTVTIGNAGDICFYGKSASADAVNATITDQAEGKAVSSISFRLMPIDFYYVLGLEPGKDYTVTITFPEGSEDNTMLIY